MGEKRRDGSTAAGRVVGFALIAYGLISIVFHQDLLALLSPEWTVGLAGILFGGVLVGWSYSVETKWIGNPTVNMITGVIAAIVAISALVRPHP